MQEITDEQAYLSDFGGDSDAEDVAPTVTNSQSKITSRSRYCKSNDSSSSSLLAPLLDDSTIEPQASTSKSILCDTDSSSNSGSRVTRPTRKRSVVLPTVSDDSEDIDDIDDTYLDPDFVPGEQPCLIDAVCEDIWGEHEDDNDDDNHNHNNDAVNNNKTADNRNEDIVWT